MEEGELKITIKKNKTKKDKILKRTIKASMQHLALLMLTHRAVFKLGFDSKVL